MISETSSAALRAKANIPDVRAGAGAIAPDLTMFVEIIFFSVPLDEQTMMI
ncbi:hypothetical protein ABIG06_001036 [Bradyrhizobium sp. USDA 326]|uniref:hypothetical protein n=1 Tax=unclassified Bradyrhizobium TaxID=2631580 RepID=UPI0035174C07